MSISGSGAALSVERLQKSFGRVEALRDVTFSVAPAEAFALVGENGSGKTTLLRILATLLRPDSGRGAVLGYDILRQARDIRGSVGYVPQAPTADPELTAAENLLFFCGLFGVPHDERRERVRALLDLAGLAERGDDAVRTFSGGMRRRLEVVRALVHEPRLLLLDEPTAGLDAQSQQSVWAALDALRAKGGLAIVAATHRLAEEGPRFDRSLLLENGAPAVVGNWSEVSKALGTGARERRA